MLLQRYSTRQRECLCYYSALAQDRDNVCVITALQHKTERMFVLLKHYFVHTTCLDDTDLYSMTLLGFKLFGLKSYFYTLIYCFIMIYLRLFIYFYLLISLRLLIYLP